MVTNENFHLLTSRIANLGARIGELKTRINAEPDALRVVDAGRLPALQRRHERLVRTLEELDRTGTGLMSHIREEMAVIEDDLKEALGVLQAHVGARVPSR